LGHLSEFGGVVEDNGGLLGVKYILMMKGTYLFVKGNDMGRCSVWELVLVQSFQDSLPLTPVFLEPFSTI